MIEISVDVLIISVIMSMSTDLIERTREGNRIPTHTHTKREGKRREFCYQISFEVNIFPA